MKVRIKKCANGGSPISKTLPGVDENQANIEAELGETIVGDFDQDGLPEHMNVGGKKHYEGGTPLAVPDNAFVFSDSKKLRLGGDILTRFGKPEGTNKKYTPAELAKQYDLNKYKKILDDPHSDKYNMDTAAQMTANYNLKLAELALIQESKKGFPQGIPAIAMPLMGAQMGEEEQGQSQEFAMGGNVPEAKLGYNFWDVDPYKKAKTKQGLITPTGKESLYNRSPQWLEQWNQVIPGFSKLDNKTAQGQMYDYMMKTNPDAVKEMWITYGLTNKGEGSSLKSMTTNGKFDPKDLTPENLAKLKSAYTDGYFGVRQFDPYKREAPITRVAESLPFKQTVSTTNFSVPSDAVKNVNLRPTNPIAKASSETIDTPIIPNDGQNIPPYWQQDKMNTIAGIRNKMNVNKYLPWEPAINVHVPDPTFYDPSRELAANSEMAGKQMDFNQAFSGPQAGYRNSAVAGQALENSANILGKYNNMNVSVANQFSEMESQIRNQEEAMNATRQKSMYNGTVVANQQYDNAMAQADDVIRQNLTGAVTNRQKTQWLCEMFPQFCVDNRGFTEFQGGKSWNSPTSSSSSTDPQNKYLELIQKLKEQYPNASDTMLQEQAKLRLGYGIQQDKNGDNIVDQTNQVGLSALMSLFNNR